MRRFQVIPVPGRGTRSILIGSPTTDRHILLGRLSEVGPEKAVLLDVSRERVIAVVGKRGSGKTHTLGVLVEGLGLQDRTSTLGSNNNDHAVLVFDTLNLFQWMAIPLESAGGPHARSQLARARSWKLPMLSMTPGFWHLSGSSPATQESSPFVVNPAEMSAQDWGLLMDVDIVTEPMGQLLAMAQDKVARTGWDTGSKIVGPLSKHSIADLIKCINEDIELINDFTPDTRRAIRQRLMAYDRTGLFSTAGTSIAEMLAPGKVSVFLLARAPEDLRTLVVFLLIRRLLEYRMMSSEMAKDAMLRGTTSPISKVPRTWVVIDEAQNIIPPRTATIANRELTRFVREGRNIGLSMAISTQQPVAIDSRVMAQVDVLIAHTMTVAQDIGYVLSNLKASPPDSIKIGRRELNMGDSLRELDVGQCLVSAVDAARTFFVEIRPRVTPHGGFEA